MSSSQEEIEKQRNDILKSQIVLVLVGLIGSGKSTFAQALEDDIPHFKRCNQDDLGDRQSVERLARQSLQDGLSVVIDRTNFDQAQRAHWVRIAREVPGTKVWCLIFDTPYNVCRERLQYRVGHPTIASPAHAFEVLDRFQSMFVSPSADEGFERIFHMDIASQSPSYTVLQLWNVLGCIALSPVLATQRSLNDFFRPSPSRGSRGHGTGRGRRPFRGGFANSNSSGATSDSWRRGGGRGSALQSPSSSSFRGRGRGYNGNGFADLGFRGGRTFARGHAATVENGYTCFETTVPPGTHSTSAQNSDKDGGTLAKAETDATDDV